MQIDPKLLRQCWFLVGPTASGKSEVALLLAERHGAEIIGLDSMTLYRGMDIGTAKPTTEDRARVPHHLFDILEPHEEFSVAQYLEAAERVIVEVLERDRIPFFVGGTGLYLRSLLRGVFDGPAADWDFRRQLEDEAEQFGPQLLHDRLRDVDSVTAARLSPNDLRRVIRALEVHHLTGQPLSSQQQNAPLPFDLRPTHVFWLNPPRDWLHERINQRVEKMFAAGLEQEVRQLLALPQPLSHTARQALGYKETIDWIEQGVGTRDDVIATIQTRTRQFAKRQCTWFRNLAECQALPINPADTAALIADHWPSSP
ncbi:tRNA (adenosine(37)-N6)-dimethylallyltransferase MiaA [bacterium]|nr:tRNA (adenosine(37)-N6)-dimethylallyltransferase MiaA [bacterium]